MVKKIGKRGKKNGFCRLYNKRNLKKIYPNDRDENKGRI